MILIQSFYFYTMKSSRKGVLKVFLKKIIPKFLEYCKKNIHYGERLRQRYTYNVTVVTPRNVQFPRNFPRI